MASLAYGRQTHGAFFETMARATDGAKGIESHLVVRAEVPYLYWV